VKSFISPRVEFYFGFITLACVAFVMPMLVTMEVWGGWAFWGYIYIPFSVGIMIHSFYREEKEQPRMKEEG
jgi:hypothetical protein